MSAQTQDGKVYRIGAILGTSKPEPIVDAFFDGLRDLGYVEGKNIVVERRYSEGRTERFPELAAELVRLKVDLMVTFTTPAALAARAATTTIPIIFPTANDPVGTGLAKSLAHPGGNVTGYAVLSPELSAKRLELLKEVVPRASRVAALYNAANPVNVPVLRQALEAARRLGIQLQPYEVRSVGDFAGAFASIAKQRPDALIVIGDQLTHQHGNEIARFARDTRLPSMFDTKDSAKAGGLMSYGPSYVAMSRHARFYADKLLRGANPADLPFEQASKFELVVNLNPAKALGITIPQSILVRADEIIR